MQAWQRWRTSCWLTSVASNECIRLMHPWQQSTCPHMFLSSNLNLQVHAW
jgi:hypothetical protein